MKNNPFNKRNFYAETFTLMKMKPNQSHIRGRPNVFYQGNKLQNNNIEYYIYYLKLGRHLSIKIIMIIKRNQIYIKNYYFKFLEKKLENIFS